MNRIYGPQASRRPGPSGPGIIAPTILATGIVYFMRLSLALTVGALVLAIWTTRLLLSLRGHRRR